MPPSLRSAPKKTSRATQGDEGSAAQAKTYSERTRNALRTHLELRSEYIRKFEDI